MVAQTAPARQTEVEIARWAISVADYHRIHEAGILGEDDRVELIDGEVRVMSPIGTAHAAIVNRYLALLSAQVGQNAIVSVQNPVQVNDTSEPQPDLALLKYRDDFYAKATPTAADVLLIIEVSDTTLAYDRLEKLPRYSLSGIPEVWITDVDGQAVERYTDPQGNQYATKQTFKRGQSISVQALPTVSLSIDSIFGER
jgi:Uma2 family endonuclease